MLILSFYNPLDVVQFVQGFQGREAVDVEAEDFIAHLGKDGVVKLEETELDVVLPLRNLYAAAHLVVLGGFELFQDLVSTRYDARRHTGQFGHVDAERVLRAATLQSAQEDTIVNFYYC